MSKKNVRLKDVQDRIIAIVNLIADAVTSTMGPGGHSVLTTSLAGAPIITKDGVTVANSIELEDEEDNLIANVIKEAAEKTNKEAGDGTTTSIALTRAILVEGQKYVKAGHNVTQIKTELNKAKNKVLEELDKYVKTIDHKDKEDLYNKLLAISTISMNGEIEISKLIAEAISKAGKYGIVNVIENKIDKNELEMIEGIKLNQGWVSPFFVSKRGDKRIILEDCSILITSHQLKNAAQLQALEESLKPLIKSAKPLLIIASETSNEFLSNMVANNTQGRLTNCAIRPPYFGNIRKEFFTDLAIITGATVIEAEQGHSLDKVRFAHLGRAQRVEITETSTTIIGGAGKTEAVQERIKDLDKQVKQINFKDLDKVEERLAKLAGGVVLIKLARQSTIEMEERRHRIEDAVNACKAALEEGIIPGGGVSLMRAATVLNDQKPGEKILLEACKEPLKRIANNAGYSGDNAIYMAENILTDDQTIDAINQDIVYAFENGIVDPIKVTKKALTNAVSIASTLLTTNVVISDIPVDTPPNPYGVY